MNPSKHVQGYFILFIIFICVSCLLAGFYSNIIRLRKSTKLLLLMNEGFFTQKSVNLEEIMEFELCCFCIFTMITKTHCHHYD